MLSRTISIASAATFLSGCAGCAPHGGNLAPPQVGIAVGAAGSAAAAESSLGSAQSGEIRRLQSASPGALVYVSDEGTNSVNIYLKGRLNGGPIGRITKGINVPDGMFVDRTGNLYVSNVPDNTITVYPPGQTVPSATYTQGLSSPFNVIVGDDGWVYVANINGGQQSYIEEFKPHSTAPSVKIVGIGFPGGLALDEKNRLYASFRNYSPTVQKGWVYRYPPHSSTGVDLGLSVYVPSGILLDETRNLVVAEQTNPAAIAVFPPGAKQPSQLVTQGDGDVFLIALDRRENRLYGTDNYPSGALKVFSYPKVRFIEAVTAGVKSPAGVALSPAAR